LHALLLVAPLLVGCAGQKLLRLESQLLEAENVQLRADLLASRGQAAPENFATNVTLEVVSAYLVKLGMQGVEQPAPGVLSLPVRGTNTTFKIDIQLFLPEKVLFLVASDYLRIEDASSPAAMVLLLTQLAAMNYDLLLGKFQLNPRSGEISLSIELNLDDGLGYLTFERALRHLMATADDRYLTLSTAARGEGM
jgi:hypothetical protein